MYVQLYNIKWHLLSVDTVTCHVQPMYVQAVHLFPVYS